jgi:hypothetical protein
VLFALLGAAAGLGVVSGILEPLLKRAPVDIPRIEQTSIDLPVLLFTSAIALATGILFGLAPADRRCGSKRSRRVEAIGDAIQHPGRRVLQYVTF